MIARGDLNELPSITATDAVLDGNTGTRHGSCALSTSIRAQGDDALSLLHSNDCNRLESSLSAVQDGFEKGDVNEYRLRNAFRPFYNLDALSEKNLIACTARWPKSYVMHPYRSTYCR